MRGIWEDIREWCRGRNAWIRLPLVGYFLYVGIQHACYPLYSSIFSAATLGVHELGHMLFTMFGQFMCIAGGTITQVAVPLILGVVFWRQRDYFAVTLAGVWLADSLFNVAVYIADAVRLELPLVSVGGDAVYHDWEYMLVSLNMLEQADTIAAIVRACAHGIMWFAILGSCAMIVCMFSLTARPQDREDIWR